MTDEEIEERRRFLDKNVILRTEVGSTAHGVTHSSNDMDEIAVYIPPMSEIVGLDRPDVFVYRPGRGPNDPSGPGDLDRTYYSLTKFVGLLAKGNPSILFALFGPVHECTDLGQMLLDRRGSFCMRRTRDAYLGYMKAQRERIQGTRGAAGRLRRSPEGGGAVDWKYAMHMVRLGVQGYEYLTTGHISTPSLELNMLLGIRSGEYSLDDVIACSERYEAMLQGLDLPDSRYSWDDWLAVVHLMHILPHDGVLA